jgi:hypothetical protein
MKLTTAAYDALGNLLEEREYEITGSFHCEGEYKIGLWVKGERNEVWPIYLTAEQVEKLQ